jgi:RNA polymerase sigma-70 factor (ECF subfamily)
MSDATAATVERIARDGYGKLLAALTARCGDVTVAEDALADAFAAALEHWPRDGVPRAPEAWLTVAARRRIIDGARRGDRAARTYALLAEATSSIDAEEPEPFVDQRLAMMFACAHPAIDAIVRGPLLLQVVLGIDAARIASAFLVAPATMSQRLVRAKRKIAAARIPLAVPPLDELPARLDAVLGAIYATFVQGWDDPSGLDPRNAGFVEEALWLGRLVARLAPAEPEALGLVALMLFADARRAARRDASGAFVPLARQDPARWNAAAIDEAEALLRRAARHAVPGRFQLEAAIQSVHAGRRYGREPDDIALLELYDLLWSLTRSPVVAINRAVALARVKGPRAALAALDAIDPALVRDYQPYWAARADVLARSGAAAQARDAYQRAIGLTVDPAVRAFLGEAAAQLIG